MSRLRTRIVAGVSAFAVLLMTLVIWTMPTSAADAGSIKEKTLLYGVARCYTSGAMKSSIGVNEYTKLDDLIANRQQFVKMPTGYASSNLVSCSDVINEAFTSSPTRNDGASAIDSFLNNAGYTNKQSGTAGKCITLTYNTQTTTTALFTSDTSDNSSWTKICAPTVNQDGTIGVDKLEVSYGGSYGDGSSSGSDILSVSAGNKYIQLDCANWSPGQGGCNKHTFTPGSTKWDDFAEALYADLYANNRSDFKTISATQFGSTTFSYSLDSSHPITDYGQETTTRSFSNATAAANKAVATLSNYSNTSGLQLSEQERVIMLQGFLDDFWHVDSYGCGLNSTQANAAKNAGYSPVTMYVNNQAQSCYVRPTTHQNDSVNGYSSDFYPDGTLMSWDEVVAALKQALGDLDEADKQSCNDAAESTRRAAQNLLNQSTTSEEYREKARKTIEELDKIKSDHGEYWYEENGAIVCYSYTDINGQTYTPPTSSTTPPNSSSSGGSNNGSSNSSVDQDECYGAAGSLGWILCPVLKTVSEGVDEIYKGYVQKQFLEIDATKVKAESSNAVYNGWKVIRDIANIIFVAMFLVVLFSQLTGIGLSNYGVKKMLPRLIMVIVLVNISFLLCQFVVDISNVLGYSMNSLFGTLSETVNNMSDPFTADGGTTGTVMTWVGVLGIAIGAGTIGSWLIPFLLVLLSSAISVFFGAVILGARQAGVFILIVLAPAAIVCYALPNAKSFFDRWLKIFTALLFVFPICGALMGGGNFASSILLQTSTSFFLTLVAMLLRVVPFFLIPGLVRGAFTAMGNIGAKISNVGNKLGRSATGSIARSDFVKRRDADLARMQGSATALRGRALSKITGKPMSDRRKAKIARQYAKYNKLKSEEAGANPYAMSPGSREYEALKNAAHQNRIDSLAKNIALENTNIATDENELAKRHLDALAALNEDQSDENLATVQAYQDMLITSDGGRTKMFDNYAQATIAGQDKGIELGAQHLLRSHTKDIKPNNRDFFSYLNEASRISNGGNVQSGSFSSFADEKGNTHYSSSHFANQGVTSYDAASIAKMDEGSLDRLIEQAGTGGLQADQKRVLEQYTRQAMTSDTIHVQDKIATKFNTLRTKMGYQAIDTNAHNITDSGTIQIQGGNNGSDNTILRTGNDDRGSRSGQDSPLPLPLSGADNYQRDSSGILLSPEARAQRQRDRQNPNSGS